MGESLNEMAGNEQPVSSVKKKVDESWKNTVEKEKQTVSSPKAPPAETQDASGSRAPSERQAPPEETATDKPDFLYFISGLGMQALAALGEAPDASGIQQPADLAQARYLIDIIEMIARKTKGNLSPDENTSLTELLHHLRLRFVQKSKAL